MSNRRRQDNNPLSRPTANSDLKAMDEAIYGAIKQADAGMQTAFPVSILDIHPDPTQPRRQIPSAVRRDWFDNDVRTLFNIWISHLAVEKNAPFDVAGDYVADMVAGVDRLPKGAIENATETPRPKRSAIETGLMEVIQLATDIRQRGLINPITITRTAETNRWQIETGERRWLAYWLLHLTFEGEDWTRIPAREVDAPSVWRQASENTARQQLNAISKARQLALLIMALYEEQGAEFLPYERFPHDRRFYAQVEDGNRYPVPEGESQRVLDAMNVKNPVQIRQYRGLLRLADEVWTAADDYNTPEKWLREKSGDIANNTLLLRMVEDKAREEDYVVLEGFITENKPRVTPVTDSQGDAGYASPDTQVPPHVDPDSGETPEPDHSHVLDHDGDGEWQPDVNAPLSPTPEQVEEVLTAAQQREQEQARRQVQAIQDERNWKRLLDWAFRRAAQQTTMWFSAAQYGLRDCQMLNDLVGARLLVSRERSNQDARAMCYSITPKGAEYIGQSLELPAEEARVKPRDLFTSGEKTNFDGIRNLKDTDLVPGADMRDYALGLLHSCAEAIQRVLEQVETE